MRVLTVEEISKLAESHVTSEELAQVWDLFPNQDFITAIGAVIMLKNRQGQERNKPFQTQAEADADVSGTAPVVE